MFVTCGLEDMNFPSLRIWKVFQTNGLHLKVVSFQRPCTEEAFFSMRKVQDMQSIYFFTVLILNTVYCK